MALHKKNLHKITPSRKKAPSLKSLLVFLHKAIKKKEIGSNYLFNRHKAMLIFLEDCPVIIC
jgi:hypothetical protein